MDGVSDVEELCIFGLRKGTPTLLSRRLLPLEYVVIILNAAFPVAKLQNKNQIE
jgi:hypothetical protein